jgi:hypothetical protein
MRRSLRLCPPPHSVENVGEEELRLFTVELKDAVG